ncbi:MAG: acetolactate synthase small subunit [Candidatus Omnitrophica bacterium CG11_big_fil_rev_8_21_14_0_20_45_26]|uniref:Acetolactate synthase small subunit n=1 Tax=Candidatus Abzuiibacterium crystallinum TaxID=1974748 RepID=A0A2H0LMP0_9BACT|nr:MAG: acetolactate synthase small subunit [Candidatus Omnitrophica bacterium CG11_big_fil_rev_8_21_14_0_20_45_26]PIW65159.1 MAG: acetolactate synthase small subunit [Candidatus Omnitrophica bacterium CG12_big_fil_rev_8_21_14_0_65_45_16]
MVHVLSALVENHFGVLARVSGLFSARGFNIDSLAVGETEDPTISRMTIVVHGNERVLDQIMKQLSKLIDIIHVEDLTGYESIERELLLIKISANATNRANVMQIVNTFRGKVVDLSPKSLAIEVTGTKSKVDAIIELLRPFGIIEVVRTGTIALARKLELKLSASRTGKKKSAKKKTSKSRQ